MHPQPETSRLCRLIDDFLRPLTFILEESHLRINKKSEQQLLISLSQVFKQIQLWTNELDSDSDNVMEVKVPDSNGRSSSESECRCGDHNCLTKIVGDMIFLLSVESRYVQHLAGNILVAISDYLTAFIHENFGSIRCLVQESVIRKCEESNWAQFVKSLCICLELAISNAFLCSLDQPQCSDHVVSHAIIALQPKLKRANWSSMACVVRVLRTILKRIKLDIDEEQLQIYMDLTSASLANVPWGVMDQNWKAIRISSDSLEGKDEQLESRSMFYVTLVQLFCSLVNLSDCDGAAKSFNEHPVICQISSLVPTLLGWCLGRGNQNNMRIFEYFQHKILMLMIRLSSKIDSEDSLLISWLNLIHEYFEDLLLLPMTQPDQEDTLVGSPFIPSIVDAKRWKGSSSHLQRLVVLLFLRCSFSLTGFTDKRAKHGGIHSDLECSYIKKGLSELQWWLQIHLSLEMLGASECYFERCTSFSISFLRLFIHEDDILFELLLLLFCVPFNTKQKCRIGQDICAFQEMNDDILFHVSNILNPIQLFHLFLSELHYDHQVLLDYLISKDTGAPSAEYILRSLRIVCDSWTKFVEFSLKGETTDEAERSKSSGKKRKVLADGSDFRAPVGSLSEKGDSVPSSPGKHHQEAILTCNVYSRTYGLTFEKAKGCLLLLKKTLQNLHQKELFPYNPKVLLRRLERFQELALQH